jgi:hypothetical protein
MPVITTGVVNNAGPAQTTLTSTADIATGLATLEVEHGDPAGGNALKATGSGAGYGVAGESNNNYGVLGSSNNSNGVAGFSGNTAGVYGSGNIGVHGHSTTGAHGVYGESATGLGVYGNSATDNGVYGASARLDGVHGNTQSTSFATAGVHGTAPQHTRLQRSGAAGVKGEGAYGVIANGTVRGVYAWTLPGGPPANPFQRSAVLGSGSGGAGDTGVLGLSTNGSGLLGTTSAGNAVEGFAIPPLPGQPAAGRAGFFRGTVEVTGQLIKPGASFKIDHPLDPENKYLFHSIVESPDRLNIYSGNATTDEDGNATVTLPDYFESLNQDFGYQLTVIGQVAHAVVGEEISDNRFTIKSDRPNVKVSWQVTGIRKDGWAKKNPMVAEQDKPDEARGKYLHPEALGQPETLGEGYARKEEALRFHEGFREAERVGAQPPEVGEEPPDST